MGDEGCTLLSNYDAEATVDDGSCEFAEEPLDCDGICLNDMDGDGVCDGLEVEGCTDPTACNYDESATDDDSSCWYADSQYDCNGQCLNDDDGDGVCDELEVLDAPTARRNYNPDATDDNANCLSLDECVWRRRHRRKLRSKATCSMLWETAAAIAAATSTATEFVCSRRIRCTYLTAINYDPSATDGTCEFNLITDECSADLDGDSAVSLSDLLVLLTQFQRLDE